MTPNGGYKTLHFEVRVQDLSYSLLFEREERGGRELCEKKQVGREGEKETEVMEGGSKRKW